MTRNIFFIMIIIYDHNLLFSSNFAYCYFKMGFREVLNGMSRKVIQRLGCHEKM